MAIQVGLVRPEDVRHHKVISCEFMTFVGYIQLNHRKLQQYTYVGDQSWGNLEIQAYLEEMETQALRHIKDTRDRKALLDPRVRKDCQDRGHEGPTGKSGSKSYKGNAGIPGWPGTVGYRGFQGHIGYIGPNGLKGDKGTDGIQGIEDLKPGDEGDAGPAGLKGRRGPPGEPGNRGSLGVHGITGDMDLPGFSGPAGPPGPVLSSSHVIEICKRLVLEQLSLYTSMVKRKCINACPLYGDVPMGPPGLIGEKGQPGKPVNMEILVTKVLKVLGCLDL
ncbi:collagen alpha-1(IX) chain-like [Narcine bancroftii]|uniref:collagen alpha-1(IX) chain-like n=1 Tax=Narcine bancroftii TaxID=1343680 RepID=UPI003831521C